MVSKYIVYAKLFVYTVMGFPATKIEVYLFLNDVACILEWIREYYFGVKLLDPPPK